MRETINALYRLLAPMFVVAMIIGGVGLSSELVKNSNNIQRATAVTYAVGGCPESAIPVDNSVCKERTITGQIKPNTCGATTEKSGRIEGICVEYQGTGCCMAQSWLDEQSSLKLQLEDLLGDNFITDTIRGLIGDITSGFGGGGGYTGGVNQSSPRCTSVSKSPSIPLRSGETVTLSWINDGGLAQTTTVTPGVGVVQGNSVQVAPSESTTYTIKLRNGAGEAKCPKVRVYVGPRDVTDANSEVSEQGGLTWDEVVWADNDANYNRTNTNNYDNVDDYVPAYVEEVDTTTTNSIEYTEPKYEDVNPAIDNATDYDNTVYEYITNADIVDDNIIKDDWYDYRDEYLYREAVEVNKEIRRNISGLTDEEIYGIWERPLSSSTGGIGLRGGYQPPEAVTDNNTENKDNLIYRIGSWFRQVLCPWCKDVGAISPNAFAAATSSAVRDMVPVQNIDCTTGSADTGVFVSKKIVDKPACDQNMTDAECRESWVGERIEVNWGLPCGNVCALTTQNNILRDRLTRNGKLKGVVADDTVFYLSCIDQAGIGSMYEAGVQIR